MLTAEIFLKELKRIVVSQPKLANHILYSENCTYGEFIYWCKNMSYSFDCAKSNDCLYVYDSILCVNCIDCDYAAECDLCYDSVDPIRCFNCSYLEYCANTQDSSFCYDCENSHHLFGCVHLKNKSYCLFNRQLSQPEYEEQIKKYKIFPPEKNLQLLENLKNFYPRTQSNTSNNENAQYCNYISHSKNCYLCFDAYQEVECSYTYDSSQNTNCLDFTYSYESELSYEEVDGSRLFNCHHTVYCDDSQDSAYLFKCNNCKNCFGCAGLSHKQYCILNRQLTKEEYERLSNQILQELRIKNLGWGELVF